MDKDIIFVCNSINNKNIREGELKILRKYEDKLYFEFGANELNIKKRFYENLETLNKDFEKILKIKNDEKLYKNLEEIKETTNDMKDIIGSVAETTNIINENKQEIGYERLKNRRKRI